MSNREYMEETKDWRVLFSKKDLETAQNHLARGSLNLFGVSEDGTAAAAYIGSGRSAYHPMVAGAPTCYSQDWDKERFSCTCQAAIGRSHWWGRGESRTCAHEAALLLYWEKQHGPWTFRETDEEWEWRKEEEKRLAEEKAHEQLKKKEKKEEKPASEWQLQPVEDGQSIFFQVPALLEGKKTNRFALRMAKDFIENGKISFSSQPAVVYGEDGTQELECRFMTEDPYESASNSFVIGRGKLHGSKCSCKNYVYGYDGYYEYDEEDDDEDEDDIFDYNSYRYVRAYRGPEHTVTKLCCHELAGLYLAWEYVKVHNPGDATDKTAEQFLSILDGSAAFEAPEEEKPKEKKKDIVISPRLVIEKDGVSLSFKISRLGGKSMILKGFRKFQEAVTEETKFAMGKNLVIDFATEDITDESMEWMSYISGKINDADRVSSKLASTRYGYYGRDVAVQSSEKLSGANLDHFYDLTEGMDLDCERKKNGDRSRIHIGDARVKVSLTGESITDENNHTVGISVTGSLPVILFGVRDRYVVTDRCMGKVTASQWAALAPFKRIADTGGNISFRIGKNRMAEFYYRILPGMLENPHVDFEDLTKGSVEELLPPEAVFTFRADRADRKCLLEATVAYEETVYPVLEGSENTGEYRDVSQEERVKKCIRRFFPEFDEKQGIWVGLPGDDALFDILQNGLPELEKYGTVLVTDVLSSRPVREFSPISFKVSVESGLLDISLLSKDITREELLEVYNSYRMKKKYHKLKDGSFISLDSIEGFEAAQEMAEKLDLSVADMISEKRSLPLFRALYLDHLLEEHEELIGSRDRTYRALIKSFRTIRDADYDVPESMENILRPYQTYGHKWMRTVTEAGFGGILADEMGLGKTLEAISLMESMRQNGGLSLALVVCPASLVYNWEEEIHRFAPDLLAVCVAGNAATRKKLLHQTAEKADDRILITSYDLLRSDIELYKDLHFSIMFIDEAQYIKNTKAAMTKAVKVVHADKRMALTGTPIENRLSELWSIFDYLMPGFLYDQATFSERFEVPISKQKDPDATEKLKKMVSPFLLRRRKQDVLKDLPPKLEEVRYARLEKKQKKLYDAQVLRMKGVLDQSKGKGEDRIKILAELTKIRQICCDPGLLFEDYHAESAKREACIELVKNAIGGGHRMLLFSQFTSMLELLEKDLEAEGIAYYKITGATPKDKRIRDVHAFNEGDVPVFLISLKAGGTGLNLTGADMVIHYDPWWNLAAQNQATDRAHRIGQEKTVTVYRLIAKDTIEERILQLQEAKRDLADAILSGEQTSLMSLSDEELLSLLE